MIEFVQEGDLTKCPLGIGRVLKGIKDLLETYSGLGLFVDGFPDVTVGTTAYLLDQLEPFEDMLFNLFTHFRNQS